MFSVVYAFVSLYILCTHAIYIQSKDKQNPHHANNIFNAEKCCWLSYMITQKWHFLHIYLNLSFVHIVNQDRCKKLQVAERLECHNPQCCAGLCVLPYNHTDILLCGDLVCVSRSPRGPLPSPQPWSGRTPLTEEWVWDLARVLSSSGLGKTHISTLCTSKV